MILSEMRMVSSSFVEVCVGKVFVSRVIIVILRSGVVVLLKPIRRTVIL